MTNTLWAIFAAGWAVVVFLVLVFFRGARCADEWVGRRGRLARRWCA